MEIAVSMGIGFHTISNQDPYTISIVRIWKKIPVLREKVMINNDWNLEGNVFFISISKLT
jgi:hypothetical protein